MTCESSPTIAIAVPSDTPAVSSGSAIARNDPNATNRTTAAAMNPRARPLVPPPVSPSVAIWPSTWNCTPLPEAEVTFDTNRFAAATETLFDGTSNVTFANATRPEGAI